MKLFYEYVKTMYKFTPELIKLFIGKDKTTALEYLKSKKAWLSEDDLSLLSLFDQYTLEVIIIHVLSNLYSCLGEVWK